MADKTTITEFVKAIFAIPDWYLLSEKEENKLMNYIRDARNAQEARLHRFIDCSAFCDEQFCFFCSADDGEVKRLCSACNVSTERN